MPLQFINGRAGSGKSTRLYKNLIEGSKKNPEDLYVVIAPDQYSLEAQKEILALTESGASLNIEVTSFSRLARQVLEEQGYSDYSVMDELKKSFVLRKVLSDCKDDLSVYSKMIRLPGFTEKMKTVISEFKQYDISNDDLEQMISDSEDRPALNKKLKDIQKINEKFNEYLDDQNITSQDLLTKFVEFIPNSDLIKRTHIFIDGFTGFTPIQNNVLGALMKYAPEVNIALTIPQDELGDLEKEDTFMLGRKAMKVLIELAEKENVEVNYLNDFDDVPVRIKDNEALSFVEENFFANTTASFDGEQDAIELHKSVNPRIESQEVASRIAKLVMEDGYRYKDIAVITGDLTGYHRFLKDYFEKYNIPGFFDVKRSILTNPFMDFIVSVVWMVDQNFSYDTLFHVLRLGIVDIDTLDIDQLENYVIRFSRLGFKSYEGNWGKKFKGMTDDELIHLNNLARRVYDTFNAFNKAMKAENATIKDYCAAIYSLCDSLDINAKIERYVEQFKNENKRDLEKEYSQIYDAYINLLEKLVDSLGDEVVTLAEFAQILTAGIENLKIGIIPPGIDTVMVGDIERTRLKDTKKIIFLVGANDGVIPKEVSGAGIITDADRDFIAEKDNEFELAHTAKDNVLSQKLYIYSLLAKPTEKMIISYSKSDMEGSVMRTSYVVTRLENIFTQLKIINDEVRDYEVDDIVNARVALDYIANHAAESKSDDEKKIYEKIFAYLNDREDSKEALGLVVDGLNYKKKEPILSPELAKKLYIDAERIKATQIEKFSSCAYRQFLDNALKLREREKYEIAGFEMGTLYHNAIDTLFAKIEEKRLDWRKIKTEDIENEIEESIKEAIDDYDNLAMQDDVRGEFIQSEVRKTVRRTIAILIDHIQQGKFLPYKHEEDLEMGRADRIDTYEEDGKIYVKVIDYKSGNKIFDYTDTYYGESIQLMLYMKGVMDDLEAQNPDKEIVPAGAMYCYIKNPYIEKNKITQESWKKLDNPDYSKEENMRMVSEGEIMKQFKMSGLFLRDLDVVDMIGIDTLKGVNVKNNGEFYKNSDKLLYKDTYKNFVNFIADQAKEKQNEIVNGNIEINPTSEDTCKYCSFKNRCPFNTVMGYEYDEHDAINVEKIETDFGGSDGLD